jgi:hypothetical protein
MNSGSIAINSKEKQLRSKREQKTPYPGVLDFRNFLEKVSQFSE